MADISLLPKEYATKIKPAKISMGKFDVLSYIFLFMVLAAWAGLYFYSNQLVGKISKIDNEIAVVPLKGRDQEIAKINEANEKIGSFKGILDSHIYSSDIFGDIEKLTLKNVYFDKFSLDIKKNELYLSGVTNSYTNFAKQLSAFKDRSAFVRAVEIQSTRITKEGLGFGLRIVLIDGVLVKK